VCTLGGFYKLDTSANINVKNIEQILLTLDARGRDAFGIISFNDETLVKSIESEKPTRVNLQYNLLMAARAIPAAERIYDNLGEDAKNTQPFYNERFIVAHNGLIANDQDLRTKFKIQTEGDVDTSILPELFSQVGVVAGVSLLQGSFALTVVDRKSKDLYLITNFMPLSYKLEGNVVYWASLPPKEDLTWLRVPSYSILKFTSAGLVNVIKLPNLLNTNKVLVVCSGGLDSVTTAVLYKKLGFDTSILFFDYGQRALDAEDWSTSKLAEEFELTKYKINTRDLFAQYTTSSLLLGNKDSDVNRQFDMESTLSYVGARNTIFATLAMGLAEKYSIGRIAFGLNLDDSTYPDNNITWLKDLENLSHSALDWNHYMKIRAPFVNMTKKEIIDVGVYIGSPFDYQISCYYPVWDEKSQSYINCGKCGCDKLREYSFKGANYKDPVKYANPEINFDAFRSLPDIWSQNRKKKLLDKDDIPYFRYLYL